LKWDVVTYSTLIDMYAKFNDTAKSKEILEKMKQDNLKPDLEGFAQQIAECAAMGDEWKVRNDVVVTAGPPQNYNTSYLV